MLKRISVFLWVLLMTVNLYPYHIVDQRVRLYYDTFKSKMDEICDPKYISPDWRVSVKIVDNIPLQKESVIGICYNKVTGFDILLRKSYWETAPEIRRRELVYHELLHCYLDVDHYPNSIMAEYDDDWPEELADENMEQFIHSACKVPK